MANPDIQVSTSSSPKSLLYPNTDQILRLPVVVKMVAVSASTLWRLEQRGEFPRRRKLSKQSIGWLSSEINEWLLSRQQVKKTEEV